MVLTDSHCHLNDRQFSEDDCDVVLNRAKEIGVDGFVVVGWDAPSSQLAVNLAMARSNIRAAIGYHPDSASDWSSESRDGLLSLLSAHRELICAWGECGLDFQRSDAAPSLQRTVFEEQIEISIDQNLPLIVHCREVFPEILDTLARHPRARAVIHCFTGSLADANRAVELGHSIGIGGIATFKKSSELRNTISKIPLDRILLETDSPYLSPEGKRGKRNEPSYILRTAQTIAPLFDISVDELARITTQNTRQFFDF